MDPGAYREALTRLSSVSLPHLLASSLPHSSHQVSRLCHPESQPVRRQRTWKRFTKQTPTDPPGATRKFYSADRGSCPCRMEGSDASTRRCRPMPSLAPRLSAQPSPPWASVLGSWGPTNHSPPRWVAAFLGQQHRPEPTRRGLPPRSLALTTCSAGGGSTSGRASSTENHTLPFTPFTRRPSGTMPSSCRLLQAARTCTAAMHRLGASGARESRPTALLM